jgi:SAM-dependent methyltransferase
VSSLAARTSPYAARMSPPPSPSSPSDGLPSVPASLILTGERTLPGIPDERYWFERHVVAYLAAADRLRDAGSEVVLDAGCGEGYGLALLARAGASRVIGVDLDPTVVAHATARYGEADPRVEVVMAELSSLPLVDEEVDLTVSFQVIEHLHDVAAYLASLRRVTRPGGEVWIATPNRLTFSPNSDVPVNPFHVREFTAEELDRVLTAAGLRVDRIVGVHHGPRLRAEEARLGRRFVDALVEIEPEGWDEELRAAVHATRAGDFEVCEDALDASLDLIAITRVVETGVTARPRSR